MGRGICYATLVDLGTTCGRAFSAFTMRVSGADRRTLVIRPGHRPPGPSGPSHPRFAFRKAHLFKDTELILMEVMAVGTLRVMNQI